MGVQALVKYAKASFRKPFEVWYRAHISGITVAEIRAFAQKPQQQSTEQSIDFQMFTFGEGNNIRVFIDEKGNPWFAGVDVCKALTYTNSRKAIDDHCKKDGVTKRYTIDSLNRKQEILFVSEPNLYRLIVKSEKPEAEIFEKWVFEEVLPTLRKTGKYEIVPKIDEPTPQVFSMAQIQAIHNIVTALIAMPIDDTAQKLAQIEKQFQATLPKGIVYKPSYVYLMLNLDNLRSKIGKANVPPSRLTELEANGSKMRLIKTIKLPYEELAFFWESTFQTMFSPFHEGREIYRLDDFQHQIFSQLADSLNAYYEDLIRRLEKGA
jgi:prophage antirepressor-like protein